MGVLRSGLDRAVASAVGEFRSTLGSDRVLTEPERPREYRDPFQYETWDDFTAPAVVMPETVEEIQEIVRAVGRHGVPLWTHSTGRKQRLRRAPARPVDGALQLREPRSASLCPEPFVEGCCSQPALLRIGVTRLEGSITVGLAEFEQGDSPMDLIERRPRTARISRHARPLP